MNAHILKLINEIKRYCTAYLQKEINLVTLQRWVDAIRSSFENDVPKKIQDGVFNFVEELEYIRFMRNEDEHFEAISNEISKTLARFYQNLFFANALPDPDFKYFSNSIAFFSSSKQRCITSFQGLAAVV